MSVSYEKCVLLFESEHVHKVVLHVICHMNVSICELIECQMCVSYIYIVYVLSELYAMCPIC